MTDMFERGIKRFTNWSNRLIATVIVVTLFGVVILGGLGFIAVGGYSTLIETMEPWAAGLIVGGVLVVAALLGVWITVAIWNKRPPTQPSENTPVATVAAQTTVDTAAHLGEFMGSKLSRSGIRITDVAIAALVAGTILGASPSVRKRLSNRKRSKNPPRSSNDDVFDKYN